MLRHNQPWRGLFVGDLGYFIIFDYKSKEGYESESGCYSMGNYWLWQRD